MIKDYESVEVFIGVDVGKSNHHAVALDKAGKKLLDKALPQDEAKLRAIIDSLASHGTLLLVVDQPATIGALPVAVARAAGIMVGYLPGLAMRRIADLHPGEAKTDARDAAIIAEAARTMPHTLRSIDVADEQAAELSMLCGFDDDLTQQSTATSNRIRGLLTQIHPALERVIGSHLDHPAMAELLVKYPTPDALKTAGPKRVETLLKKFAPRAGSRWAADIFTALAEQSVVVSGTAGAAVVLPQLAGMLASLRKGRAEVLARVEALVEAHPRPELDSCGRDQDGSTHHHRGHRQGIPLRWAPRLLRRPGPGDLAVRDLDPRRSPLPQRQQSLETSPVPLRIRSAQASHLTRLLRPQTCRGKTPQPSPDRTRPASLRHAIRHASRRHPLRRKSPESSLTKT